MTLKALNPSVVQHMAAVNSQRNQLAHLNNAVFVMTLREAGACEPNEILAALLLEAAARLKEKNQ